MRGAKRGPPPAITARAAAAAGAATARTLAPALARVTLLLLQHLGPDQENLTQVCSEYFLWCVKLRVWKRTETGFPSGASPFESELRLLSIALF